jgi:hypothetical protein
VRFVHSFVRRGSQCRQNKFLKNCTALRCYHLGGEKTCTVLCELCTALCGNHLVGDFLTFLPTSWYHRWWIITFLWVGGHIAALSWPLRILKIKTNFNKYFCYRILESGEGSAADTLQLSPTPPQTNLRGGVSHKGAWRIHPHLHQHRRHHHNTSRDYCTTFVVVKFSLLYEKFI